MSRCAVLVSIIIASASVCFGQSSVSSTKHNLSISGPGSIRSDTESRVCVFCHTPHNASVQAPLWNRSDPGGPYQMYWSRTLDAYPSQAAAPQPTGVSKRCLSCHDGTIALGSTVASGTISMSGGVTTMPPSSTANVGQDLSGDHPVSFQVTQELIDNNNSKGDMPLLNLVDMRVNGTIRLGASDYLQCTTCHDPHSNTHGNFLVVPTVSQLCRTCHK